MKKTKVRKDVQEEYAKFSEYTQLYMNSLYLDLEKKYSKIPDVWSASLYMLASQIETYRKCEDIIRKEGIMTTDRFGAVIKHPALKAQTDACIQIQKLLESYGATLKAGAKLNLLEMGEAEDDFLDGVMKDN